MKKILIIGGIIAFLAVIALIAYNAMTSNTISGTKFQVTTLRDRGQSSQILMSPDELDNVEKIIVPTDVSTSGDTVATATGKVWIIDNPDGVQCFTLDPTKGLPTGVMDCQTGTQVQPGTVFSYVGKPNAGIKLHR